MTGAVRRPGHGSTFWQVHGERDLYASPWLRLALIDVETADGHRYEHHTVRSTGAAVGTLVRSDDSVNAGILMLWRHRVITGEWGWEVPAGRVEPGESPIQAGVRETLEETGWAVEDAAELVDFYPIGGTGDVKFHIMTARALAQVGEPDPNEAERLEWFGPDELRELVTAGLIREGLALTAVLAVLSGLAAPGVARRGSSQLGVRAAASPAP